MQKTLNEAEREIMKTAKSYLMDKYLMTELEAYKWIRNTAMQGRFTKIEVATAMLKKEGIDAN